MRNRHKRARNGIVILTAFAVGSLLFYGQKVRTLIKEVDHKISVQEAVVEEKSSLLEEKKRQLEQMDSLEFVQEVATKQLKMVEKDTIVIRPRE